MQAWHANAGERRVTDNFNRFHLNKLIGSSSLGVAAVLFVGLAFGALQPDMKLPELGYQLRLVVFVYTVGLSSGRQFFASFRRRGLRDNLFILGMLILATIPVSYTHLTLPTSDLV